VVVALLLGASLARPATGQTLNEAVRSAVNNNCAGLGAPPGSTATTLQGLGFGPNLSRLCAGLPTGLNGPGFTSGGDLSGGSITGQTRLEAEEEERRVSQRLKERREERRSAGLGFFVSGEFERFNKDVTRFEPGFESDTWGGTAGADYTFANLFVAGIAFNYANTQGSFERGGGSFDTDSFGLLGYSSFFPAKNVFIDAIAGYARKLYSVDRRIAFTFTKTDNFPANDPRSQVTTTGKAVSDTDANEFKAGLNTGYDFVIRNLTIGPRVGVNYKYIKIDDFREHGKGATTCFTNAAGVLVCTGSDATGLELAYDRQTQESLMSVLGVFASVAFSTEFGVLVPQTTLEYVHEFADDQRTIRFKFVEDNAGGTKLRFKTDPPDRDYFNVGAGLVLVLPGGYSPFINYRARLGYSHERSHTVTAGLRFAF